MKFQTMARRGRPRKREITIQSTETKNVFGILSLIVASLLLLSFFVDSPGLDFIKKYLGNSVIPAFIFFGNFSLKMFGTQYSLTKTSSLLGQLLLIFSTSGFFHFFADSEDAQSLAERGELGGVIGYYISHVNLIDIFAKPGALIIIASVLIISITLTLSLSLSDLLQVFGRIIQKISNLIKSFSEKMRERREKVEEESEEIGDPMISDFRTQPSEDKIVHEKEITKEEEKSNDLEEKDTITTSTKKSLKSPKFEDDILEGALVHSSLQYPNWKLPPTSLLSPPVKTKKDQKLEKKNADIIEQTLQSFGVKTKVVDVLVGPTVTQYALNIALGTKVSRISNLRTDLALALAAPTGTIRIEAPIPGTSYIGVEVPNVKKETVFIREILESEEMKSNNMYLPASVGKSIAGKNIIADLKDMPHLLIAGATGSGKSVLTNSFIISLLANKTPDEVRMIMVDPKQVELSDYNGIPHLLTPVITDIQKVVNSLKWAIVEMEKRYTIFKHAKVRNLEKYNEKMGFAAMPYIIIIIDEMADLILTTKAESETAIVRLAQKARATGIHLILATQRPSIEIITGLIKANIPGRIGMSVATQIDSRVILDQGGAETLLGKGDMLFKEPDKAKTYRVQGVWVSQEEVRRVVRFIKSQVGKIDYETDVTKKQAGPGATKSAVESTSFSDDEYFVDAVRIVCNAQKGSASLLQRKLSIGYNRAARLLDELYQHGIVGPEEGSKPRKVLISDPDTFLSQKAKDKKNE